jgi:DNA-binding response OmpR family regulator
VRVFLDCEQDREKQFRDILEDKFTLDSLKAGDVAQALPGDVILSDLRAEGYAWRDKLAEMSRSLREEVCLIAVLDRRQVGVLDNESGLTDFVVDGFTAPELVARIRRNAAERMVRADAEDPLEIDEIRYEIRFAGKPIELTYKEFELLRFLSTRPGRVFTRERLLEQVWGYDYFGGSRTVDVHIRRIRSKIEREGHTYIRTVRGVGYLFEHGHD